MNENQIKNIWCVVFFLSCLVHSTRSQVLDYPATIKTANTSQLWKIDPSPVELEGSFGQVAPFLYRVTNDTEFFCGFYCNFDGTQCLFSVLIHRNKQNPRRVLMESPQLVWYANRDYPVKAGATLELTKDGDFLLADVDGTQVWSTNTSSKSVKSLTLTAIGNLVLLDENNDTVWESVDYPTDTLVDGQTLYSGMELTASMSTSNWSKGMFGLAIKGSQLIGYVDANPPQSYFFMYPGAFPPHFAFTQVVFAKGMKVPKEPVYGLTALPGSAARFMKLEPDGHLRVHEWGGSDWGEVGDLLTAYTGECGYPMVCGKYGVCLKGECGCPEAASDGTIYFKPLNGQPNLGCELLTPISCERRQDHILLELKNTDYFFFQQEMENVDVENCKLACLTNCSCKAAIFQYNSVNTSMGDCFLPSEIFSLRRNEGNNYKVTVSRNGTLYTSSQENNTTIITFVKVQNIPASAPKNRKGNDIVLPVGLSLGAFFGVLLLIGAVILYLQKKRDLEEDEEDDDCRDELPGLSTRFSYEDLKSATENFSKKLGQGGFGSVFEGTMGNGTKVAVKRLNGIGQVKKSFLAEVKTIGNIHHVNLVRLIGYCAEKSETLLVYEYMCNGSLDKWIFRKNEELLPLEWRLRRKIISGMAKGLAYLHEECRQKILHLDIKPQNILVDENFEGKVADFGLSKLIAKEQSRVVASMQGTPGYMAPEWMSSVITDKVDVYSFGVVVLEILCGRKNLDRNQPEEEMHLLSLFERKAADGQLMDIIDKSSEDMQLHVAEVTEMLRIAAWCLQSEFTKRPPISVVVKVLEGLMEVDSDLDFRFTKLPVPKTTPFVDNNRDASDDATVLLPQVLSGPR
ncbi:G-type lectin S-receptor-like serine/threonine-protein kinase SD2-5 [Rhododendron vialii]|uniref:G-type lectin S-receptor-like serine/threonine-protein kinase SD2-5 n=1 Tax=Rhododendron vialii TaxID=182163 RepID=UPI00265EB7BD|nr:G-type lectin S-receptor-like serine/threonine-protein kinase SD2-5 [Rhododendron vialii]